MKDDWWWSIAIGIWVGVFILNVASGDIKFSIPSDPPYTEKSRDLNDDTTIYYIIYDESFSGHVIYNSTDGTALVYITNNSKEAYWLDDIKVHLWTKKHERYGLKITSIDKHNDRAYSAINPRQSVGFHAVVDGNLPVNEINGFSIHSEDQPQIRFGYEKVGWWNRTRWFLAEHSS